MNHFKRQGLKQNQAFLLLLAGKIPSCRPGILEQYLSILLLLSENEPLLASALLSLFAQNKGHFGDDFLSGEGVILGYEAPGGERCIIGSNWYGYCSNNPLKYVDPTGLTSTKSDTDYTKYHQSYYENRRVDTARNQDVANNRVNTPPQTGGGFAVPRDTTTRQNQYNGSNGQNHYMVVVNPVDPTAPKISDQGCKMEATAKAADTLLAPVMESDQTFSALDVRDNISSNGDTDLSSTFNYLQQQTLDVTGGAIDGDNLTVDALNQINSPKTHAMGRWQSGGAEHWVTITGYFNDASGRTQFRIAPTSTNDENRTYFLGTPPAGDNNRSFNRVEWIRAK